MTQTTSISVDAPQSSSQVLARRGWARRKLGDCVRLINGRAYSQHEMLAAGTPIIRIQNLNGSERWFYSNLTLPEDQYCDNGDLLFAWSATFGPYIWNGSKAIYHYHIWKIIPNELLDKEFAYYLLAEITAEIKAASHGLAMLHMTKQKMEGWEVNVPPLSEQKRIVALLNERMASVERARAAAEAQLEAASELPASYLRSVFDSPEAQIWQTRRLEEVCSISTGTTPDTNRLEYYKGDIPFVKTSELLDNIITAAETHISEQAVKDYRLKVYPPGTVLLAMYGQGKTRGRVGLLDFPAATTQNAAAVVPDIALDSEYLWLWFRSRYKYLRGIGYQGDLSHLSLSFVKRLEIPVPALSIQRQIATTLKTQLEASARGRDTIRMQFEALTCLPAAILREAFSGKL